LELAAPMALVGFRMIAAQAADAVVLADASLVCAILQPPS
jgi:hypothetical protein